MKANVLFVQQLLFGLPCTSSTKEAEEAISDEDTDLGMLTDNTLRYAKVVTTDCSGNISSSPSS
jgi:hypothetical protein